MTKFLARRYGDIIRALAALEPSERVTVIKWVAECYCRNCGYPAPPDGDFCCEFSDRAEVSDGGKTVTRDTSTHVHNIDPPPIA